MVKVAGNTYVVYADAIHVQQVYLPELLVADVMDNSVEAINANETAIEVAAVFQARDLELLGLDSPSDDELAMRALDDYWGAAEIGAVALDNITLKHTDEYSCNQAS